MDLDQFDDDIADEDFLAALDQASSSSSAARESQSIEQQLRIAKELEELPSDAFSSPELKPASGPASRGAKPFMSSCSGSYTGSNHSSSGNLRQTTLWGGEATLDAIRHSQPNSGRVYRADVLPEEPTQHEIDRKAMKTWVYPINLGAIRDYQFSIVKNSLFNNTLVALPTGLGKTFIAATVMLNFYRWTKTAKIVFVAPTKPLVSQQIDACFHIAGIPRSDTTLLTGDIAPALRVDEWEKRRVFFMTPQTLLNDLSHGYADPKSIALMVIDEAHRATGEYAYAKATKLIRRFSKSFRVLALTATPGSKIETVQEVIDNLGISHCEIRTEESIDIRQYVHDRNIDQVVLDPSDEINLVGELFTDAIKPLTEKLSAQNIWYGRNPMALTTYGLIQAQKEWFATRGNRANQGVQFMMRAVFSVLTSLAHSIKLLQFHGIKPFYDNMVDLRSGEEGKGEKGSKYKRQIVESSSFQDMMNKISGWLKTDSFVGHPKLTALAEAILNHFMDAGETTRVIVFSEYRDSAEEIVRTLAPHKPLIKATIFVGQADGKRGEGMKQKQQIETIERFKKGDFNVLVATSIGEEGLDIGQVDLIVCYDASASPIRMLQRMGRTGRKRAGKIVLLLMRGKEEEQFAKSKDNYEKMQKLICEGSRFNFRFDLSTRIVPRDIRPEVDKRHVEIPVENTQDASLPEPKKRRAVAGKKKPPKKFHMPDGVVTGFQKLTDLLKPVSSVAQTAKPGSKPKSKPKRNAELDDLAHVPELERVVLGADELQELNRSYRDLPFNHDVVEETDMPSMTAHPERQRRLGPVVGVQHGTHTKRCVEMLRKMGSSPDGLVRKNRHKDTSRYLDMAVKPFVTSDGETEGSDAADGRARKRPTAQVEAESEVSAHEWQQKRRKRSKTLNSRSTTAKTKDVRSTASKTAGRKTASMDLHVGSEAEETDDNGSADGDEERTTGRTMARTKKRGKGGGKSWQRSGHGINSDELGDDCERDSDLVDVSDSDNGSDLVGFVVDDKQVTSSMQDTQASSPIDTTETRPMKPYFVPTQFTATQDSDGVPDVEVLVGKRSKKGDAGRRRIRGKRPCISDESDV